MMARISAESISGAVKVPSSKSYAQRCILIAALSDSETAISGLSYSEDEQVAIDIARKCGSRIAYKGRSISIIPAFSCPGSVFVGESATSYRLSIGLLSARRCRTEFNGMPGLASRPVEPLMKALAEAGVRHSIRNDGFITLDATEMSPADVAVDGSLSSQYISSILLFQALSGRNSVLTVEGSIVSGKYIDITIDCLGKFGMNVSREGNRFCIEDGRFSSPRQVRIEGDYSSASFMIVLGLLSSESGLSVEGLKKESLQPDSVLLDIFKEIRGMQIIGDSDEISIFARSSQMPEIHLDVDKAPDLAPPLSVIGIFSTEGVVLSNYERLEIKESKRASEIIRLAESFGAEIVRTRESITIRRGTVRNPGKLAFDDHRMIMSAIIAGIASGYKIEYENLEKINKSYPDFLKHLKSVGAEVEFSTVR